MKKEYIIPIFVPHLGCPNNCVFCNQKKISGQIKPITAEDVKNTIEYYLNNFKEKNLKIEVAFFGGSFTGIEIEKQEELLSAAYEFIKQKKVDSIRISTRPDYINIEILKRLKKYKVKTIELGVQTTNDFILEKTKRNHTYEDVKKASKLIRRYGFVLGHQMMIGLPDSTKKDELQTVQDLIKLKPKIVRIYPVLVIKGTELEEFLDKDEYEALTVEQAVERAKEALRMFNKKKIKVIRVGLQNTDTITDPTKEGTDVVAGPFHPAFRQLVESNLWYDVIVDRIKKINAKVKTVNVIANPYDVNNIIGHKKENINKLKELYNVEIKIVQNSKMKKGNFKIKVTEIYNN